MTGAAGALAAMASTPSMGVTAVPSLMHGTYRGTSTSPQNITTNSTLASVSGGTAPFTYAWTQYGSSPDTWTINSPSASTTSFTATSVPTGVSATASFKITVTDAAGVVATAIVNAQADNDGVG